MLESPKHKLTLLRNNSGALTDSTGRTVRFGLGNTSSKGNENFKSSDLIGILPTLIIPEMVGTTIGVFVAVEVKRENWNPKNLNKREKGQKNFIDFVISHGGIAAFCNSVDSFLKMIGK